MFLQNFMYIYFPLFDKNLAELIAKSKNTDSFFSSTVPNIFFNSSNFVLFLSLTSLTLSNIK